MNDVLRFTLNDRPVEVRGVPPTTTLLDWLRQHAGLTGTKEGCAEGDCGACTVVLADPGPAPQGHDGAAPGGAAPGATGAAARSEPQLRAVNSCLVFLPMLAGRHVWTVEGLKRGDRLHPAQEAMVQELGSQCGYCTPGIVMSLVEACHRDDLAPGAAPEADRRARLDDQLCGNLCRCTGYRPIRDAAAQVAGTHPDDGLRARATPLTPTNYAAGGRWIAPGTLPELFDALASNPDARIVCGGTDLALEVTKRHREIPCVISVEAIPELRRIERIPGGHRFGAAVLLSDLEAATADTLPPLARMLRYFASRQIKNRGTLGGNLCNASPIGDTPPVLLALGATALIAGKHGGRRVPLDEFFLGYRQTAVNPGEVLVSVEVPDLPADARAGAYKVSKRRELDISAVCAGFLVRLAGDTVTEARLAYGGMAATPKRASSAEAALVGHPWTEASVRRAMDALANDFTPLTDHRGSSWYRGTLARNLLYGFWLETRDIPVRDLPERPVGTVLVEAK